MVELPPLDEEGQLELVPETIMVVREKELGGSVIPKYLIKWKNLVERTQHRKENEFCSF